MDISINFYNERGTFRDKTDCMRPFKDQLGPKSLSLNSNIKLHNLRDRIDIRWKKNLEKIVASSRQFKAVRAKVYITRKDMTKPEDCVTEFNFVNPKSLSNDIANYILVKTKGEKKNLHGISAKDVLKLAKVKA